MDRRVSRTKNIIFEAFNNLLMNKNYSKITIQEIIDEANIGRSTFYNHFETKDDLLNGLCIDLFEHVFISGSTPECDHNFPANRGNLKDQISHILYHLQNKKKNMIGLLSSDSGEFFYSYFRLHFSKWVRENTKFNNNGIPEAFLVNHITGSLIETIKWWIKNKCNPSPEKLALYYESVTYQLISST